MYKNYLFGKRGWGVFLGLLTYFLFIGIYISPASAQEPEVTKGPIAILMRAEIVKKNDDGSEKLIAATQVEPGDIIVYTVTCKNTSPRVITEIKPVIPIPVEMEFIGGSIKPDTAEGSADGSRFASIPLQHDVKKEDGSVVAEPLPEALYRAIRWNIPELAPEESAEVSVRARVKVTTTLPSAVSESK